MCVQSLHIIITYMSRFSANPSTVAVLNFINNYVYCHMYLDKTSQSSLGLWLSLVTPCCSNIIMFPHHGCYWWKNNVIKTDRTKVSQIQNGRIASIKFGSCNIGKTCFVLSLYFEGKRKWSLRQNFSWIPSSVVLSEEKGSGTCCYCCQPNHQKISSNPQVNQWLMLPVGTSLRSHKLCWTISGSVMCSSHRTHELGLSSQSVLCQFVLWHSSVILFEEFSDCPREKKWLRLRFISVQ